MNYSALLNPEHIKPKTTRSALSSFPAYLEIRNFFKRIELLIVGELAAQEGSRMQTGGEGEWYCPTGVKCLRKGSYRE